MMQDYVQIGLGVWRKKGEPIVMLSGEFTDRELELIVAHLRGQTAPFEAAMAERDGAP